MINVGIVGATGYTGVELVKILSRHPNVAIKFATSDSYVGKKLSDAFPCPYDIPLIAHDAAPLDAIDAAFLALPHGASADFAKRALDAGARVIDLSADFRLHDNASVSDLRHPHAFSMAAQLYVRLLDTGQLTRLTNKHTLEF